jgi:hypothetical protein
MLYFPTIISVLEVLAVTVLVLLTVAFVTIAERKTMASMQRRQGPISDFVLVKQSSNYYVMQFLAGVVLMVYLRLGFLLLRDTYCMSHNAIILLLVASMLLVLIISYIQCSLVNSPFTLTAKVKSILALKAVLLLGIVILTIFDITHTILDIVAQCGAVLGNYCAGYYALNSTMNNPGGGSGANPGGTTGNSGANPAGGSGANPGGTTGNSGANPAGGSGANPGGTTGNPGDNPGDYYLTKEQAKNYGVLMNRYKNGHILARLEYDILIRNLDMMTARANRALADENTTLTHRIRIRQAMMEFDQARSHLLVSVRQRYPDYRLP